MRLPRYTHAMPPVTTAVAAVILISANAEWRVVREVFSSARIERSPYGEWFTAHNAVFVQGGWGKVDAAASAQYAIDRWQPRVVFNLGTCGGFTGRIDKHEIVLVDRTVIYDIVERMGDSAEAIRDYTTTIDLAWLGGAPLPSKVRRAPLVSADRDIDPADIPRLEKLYGAVAADWESGAISRVAARNGKRVVILRGVSDLVAAETGGEAYGHPQVFAEGTARVMRELLGMLPQWLQRAAAQIKANR